MGNSVTSIDRVADLLAEQTRQMTRRYRTAEALRLHARLLREGITRVSVDKGGTASTFIAFDSAGNVIAAGHSRALPQGISEEDGERNMDILAAVEACELPAWTMNPAMWDLPEPDMLFRKVVEVDWTVDLAVLPQEGTAAILEHLSRSPEVVDAG